MLTTTKSVIEIARSKGRQAATDFKSGYTNASFDCISTDTTSIWYSYGQTCYLQDKKEPTSKVEYITVLWYYFTIKTSCMFTITLLN